MAERVSDAAVKAKTGRTWPEWFAVLDREKAATMPHKEIASLLGEKYGVSDWWRQMVTVGYEKERGLRVTHQRPKGFSVTKSKTLPVSVQRLFDRWHDAKTRRKWLKQTGLVVRRVTPNKTMRITWPDGTDLEVNFIDKGANKSQVAIEHSDLANLNSVDAMRTFWTAALDRLKETLVD